MRVGGGSNGATNDVGGGWVVGRHFRTVGVVDEVVLGGGGLP